MSDIFSLLNFSDMTVQTAPDGGTLHLNVPTNTGADTLSALFRIKRTDSASTINTWVTSGLQNLTVPAPAVISSDYPSVNIELQKVWPAGTVTTATLENLISGADSGDYQSIHLVFHWVDDAGQQLAPPVSWLTAGVLDLQWEQFTGRISSAALATLTTGLKQGSDVLFGAVVFQAGTLIIANITTLSLVIRPALDLEGYGPFITDTTAVDLVDLSGGHKYYRVNFNLASDALTAAFSDLNDALATAIGTSGEAAAKAAAEKIPCVLELRATHTSGIYTSLSYPLNILQALTP